jgi:hypothetical protein
MIRYYHTTKTTCQCKKTFKISKVYGVDIPCEHRVACNASFPTKSAVTLPKFGAIDLLSTYVTTDTNIDISGEQFSEPPLVPDQDTPKEKRPRNSFFGQIWEETIDFIMYNTHSKNREEIIRRIFDIFHHHNMFSDLYLIVTSKAVKLTVKHRCLMLIEKI